jgi:hypothetical protein
MLGWLVRRRIAAFERDFDYDMSYACDIYDASPRAFFRFSKILGISSYRQDVPKEAWYAAKLAATLAEDCGPCTQLVVKMAERDGMSAAAIRAVLLGDAEAMPPDSILRKPSCAATSQSPITCAARSLLVGEKRRWSRWRLPLLLLAFILP